MYIKFRTFIKGLFYQKPFIWKVFEVMQGMLFVVDYLYFFKFWGHNSRFSIKEINIEFSSKCNLRCRFCSLDHRKATTYISVGLLEKFFKNWENHRYIRSVEIINLHNGGEILMHPHWIRMLEVIKKYKDFASKRRIKFPRIYLLTNGMLLDEVAAHHIVKMNVIDVVGISMDGGTPELFEEIRRGAKWEVLYENLKIFDKLNRATGKKITLYSICCIPEQYPLNTSWMHPEFKEALSLLDRYELRRLHNWAGDIKFIPVKEKKHKIGCGLLMRQLVLLPNGDVTVCCNDLNSKGVIGNINESSLYEIYKSKRRLDYIEKHLAGKKREISLCRDCETF